MYYIGIVKTSYDMNDGIAFTDVRKELVAETFTFAGALYKTCDVNEFDYCINIRMKI